VPREGVGTPARAGPIRLRTWAPRPVQTVVTGRRLLMRTLSAVYENAPSPIPVLPKFSSVGCNGRALTSVFMASIQTQ
jgi:hypothetical protein